MEKSKVFQYIFQTNTGVTHTPRLHANLAEVRAKVSKILSRIPQDNPWITIHDISHIDALWEMLDVLLGSTPEELQRYKLNPLEGFILGASFLLRDAAMTLVSIQGGIKGLANEPECEQLIIEELTSRFRRRPSRQEIKDYDLEQQGRISGLLGRLLRATHARNAERLATLEWKYYDETWRLIADDELRTDWGALIGRIARSHHDDVQELRHLPTLDSIRSGKGVSWKVRPQFLACLLRCADIIQLHREVVWVILAHS